MESPGSCGLRRALLCGTSWGLTTIARRLGRALPGHDRGLLNSLLQLLLQTHSNRVPTQQGGRTVLLPGRKAARLGQPSPPCLQPATLAAASGIRARQPLILG